MPPPWPTDLLACPACRRPLATAEPDRLRCTGCDAAYDAPATGVPDLIPAAVRARMGDPGDPGWSRWNEALRGLETWRRRRAARARGGTLPSDGTSDRTTADFLERAGVRGVVVDVGAKDGSKGRLLPAGTRYLGVDPFASPPNDPPPGHCTLRGVAEALPVASGVADAVMSLAAFDYFVDGAGAVREWRRVLKPGGRLAALVSVVAPPVARARNAGSRLARLAGALAAAPRIGPTATLDLLAAATTHPDRVHTHYYTREAMLDLVTAEFDLLECRFVPQTASTILYLAGRRRETPA